MKIRNFEDKDIPAAVKMAYDVWGSLLGSEPVDFKLFIQENLVRSNDSNRKFSFCIEDPGPAAYILAAFSSDQNKSFPWFMQKYKTLLARQRKIAELYREFSEKNDEAVKKYMKADDIQLTFFISAQKGRGSILLNYFEQHCKDKDVKNIYLWTDTSSNFSYYEKHGFQEIERFGHGVYNGRRELQTIIFKKKL